MATNKPLVSFPEGVVLPAPPRIIARGRVQFNQQGDATVVFNKLVEGDYYVLLTADGNTGGAITRATAVFSANRRTAKGFTISSSDTRCRQAVDWAVLQ